MSEPGSDAEQPFDLDQGVAGGAALGLAAAGAPVAQGRGAHRVAALDQPLVQPREADPAAPERVGEGSGKLWGTARSPSMVSLLPIPGDWVPP